VSALDKGRTAPEMLLGWCPSGNSADHAVRPLSTALGVIGFRTSSARLGLRLLSGCTNGKADLREQGRCPAAVSRRVAGVSTPHPNGARDRWP